VDDFFHPLAAAYSVTVLPHVRALLAADRLRPVFLFDAVTTRVIEPHELADVDPEFRSLRNLNTPEEYEQALRDVNFTGSSEGHR
jgi:molybdopterin-guanine dinucleotide biosynthesis protein A